MGVRGTVTRLEGIKGVCGVIPTLDRGSHLYLWPEQNGFSQLPRPELQVSPGAEPPWCVWQGWFLQCAFMGPPGCTEAGRSPDEHVGWPCMPPAVKDEITNLLSPNQLSAKVGDKWGPSSGRVRGVYSTSQRGMSQHPKPVVETGQTSGL